MSSELASGTGQGFCLSFACAKFFFFSVVRLGLHHNVAV